MKWKTCVSLVKCYGCDDVREDVAVEEAMQ